ncbi:MAG: restriction endonuclease subunit S [Nitrospiraceae bacterium]
MKRQRAPLGELCRLVKGTSPISKTPPGPYPLVTTGEERKTADSFQFDMEAVCIPLISSTGHGHASLKRIHYQSGKFALANLLAAALVKDDSTLSPKFLTRYLNFTKDGLIVPLMTGAANMSISIDRLATVPVEFPLLTEQERIVKLLDEADELRKLRAQADRRTVALLPSLFYEMLDEAEDRNCPWPKTALAGLCSRIIDCPHATPTYAMTETLYACVRSSDIQEGKLDWSSTKYVDKSEYTKRVKVLVPRPGDVVFCREGARLGNAALVTNEKEVCLGQRMMLFRVEPNAATPEFLCALLLSPAIQKLIWSLAGGSASPHLNVGDIKEFVAALPPLPLQKEFAARVSEIRAVQAEQAASCRRLDDLFKSMLHRAFNGAL